MNIKKNISSFFIRSVLHAPRSANRGFTLIELLVVIAIIGILASIVLSSLNTARTRANDAKIQGQLSSMRAQAELWTPTDTLVAASGVETIVATGINPISGVTLFSDDFATGSLTNFVGGLPTGTVIYYYYDEVPPSEGGLWVFAASTSTGASCVSWAGNTATFEGDPPVLAADFEAAFPNITSSGTPAYSCQ